MIFSRLVVLKFNFNLVSSFLGSEPEPGPGKGVFGGINKMTLLDRDFPADLQSACISFSGETVLTKAVRSSLRRLFDINIKYKEQSRELAIVSEKLTRLQSAVQSLKRSQDLLDSALDFSMQKEAFFLEAEKRPSSSWKVG